MTFKLEKANETLRELVASFVLHESNGASLITVTHLIVVPSLTVATVFISVYPENKEIEALDFLKRKAGELRKYVTSRIKMRKIPSFEFVIDKGEKNRQRIDELTK
ncbi:MAG: ribosome-binding factor A [Patescibacteria group bacterium]